MFFDGYISLISGATQWAAVMRRWVGVTVPAFTEGGGWVGGAFGTRDVWWDVALVSVTVGRRWLEGPGIQRGGLFSTVADGAGAGSAFARAQGYGSDDAKSLWVDGLYDYKAVSDYLPLAQNVPRPTNLTTTWFCSSRE